MNQAKFDIQLTANNDGTWHAEAVAAWPEVKIFSADAPLLSTAMLEISRQIAAWIDTWPEHLRPGYQPPVFAPGTLVEHSGLPGNVLEVVGEPVDSAVYAGKVKYTVKTPAGGLAVVLGDNLRRLRMKEEDICQT